MKKFFYPLAAAAALFTGNLFAQEAALITPNADSAFDCVQENTRQDYLANVSNAVLVQKVVPCLTGELTSVTVNVQNASQNTWFLAELVDTYGTILDATRFTHRDVIDGTIALNLLAEVKENRTYALQITASEEGYLRMGYHKTGSTGSLYVNGEAIPGVLTSSFGFKKPSANHSAVTASRGTDVFETKAMANECLTKVGQADGRVDLLTFGHYLSQSFEACADGELTFLRLNLATYTANFSGKVQIESEGELIYETDINRTKINNNCITLPLDVKEVSAGQNLTFFCKLNTGKIAFRRSTIENEGLCTLNGLDMDFNLAFTAYVKEKPVREPHDLEEVDITTFPNPFKDRINVRMENAPKGPATVQLLDFSGNIIRTETVVVKDAEGNISFDTHDIDGAGYYALRIIQGDQIKNVTVLKR